MPAGPQGVQYTINPTQQQREAEARARTSTSSPWGFANYIPVVSNVKGAVEGNLGQSILGPAYQIPAIRNTADSLSGQASKNAANAAASQQRSNAQQAADLAESQRRYAEQTTATAQGYYGNANSAYQNLFGSGSPAYSGHFGGPAIPATAPGSMTTPGYGEQAYRDYGGRLTQPTNSQAWYEGSMGQLASPSASESFFNPAAYQRTSNAENFYNQNQGRYQSNTMNDAYQGLFNDLGNSQMQRSFGELDQRLSAPARTSQLYDQTAHLYSNDAMSSAYQGLMAQINPQTGKLYQNFADIDSSLAGRTNLEDEKNALKWYYENSDMVNRERAGFGVRGIEDLRPREEQALDLIGQEAGPSTTQNEYGQIRTAFDDPGMYEQFVQKALAGEDPYYKRLSEKGSASLDASMNARGGFNSGAALLAQGNRQSALDADQYHMFSDMTRDAQAAEMARASGLQGLAGQTEGEIQQRIKAQDTMGQENYLNKFGLNQFNAQLAEVAGNERRAIASGLVGQYAATDAGRLANNMGRVQLGAATDASTLARTMGSGQLADMAATQRLNYMGQRANVANMSDSQELGRVTERGNLANMTSMDQYNRTMGRGTLANMTAGTNLNYLNSQQNAAMGADNSYLNLLQGGQQAANSASSAQLARLMGGGQLANSADSNNRANITSYLGAGAQAQGLAESRQMAALHAAMGLGGAQSNLAMQGGQMGMNAYDRWMDNSMGYKSNAAQVDMSSTNAQMQQYWNLLGMGVGIAGGGPAGAGAVQQLGQQYQQPYQQPQLNASFVPPTFTQQPFYPPPNLGIGPLTQPTW